VSPLAPAVLVFEKAPRWEAELKRRLSGRDLLVRPCRSAGDVVALCRVMPGSVVVNDFAAGAAEGLRLLEALLRQRLRAFVVVVASSELGELEWPARELGAAQFVSDTIGGEALAQNCRRMLAPDTGWPEKLNGN
jgi:ActR/RegA family two-component response regulator